MQFFSGILRPFRPFLVTLIGVLAMGVPDGRGQFPNAAELAAEEALAREFSEAMAAFQAGDYAKAAAGFEGVLAKAGKDAQLESVYFTLGASYFNMEQYAKAAETLKAYQSKYPKGTRAAEAGFFLAQAEMQTKDFTEAAAQFARLEGVPALREQALFHGARALKEAGRADEAVRKLEALVGAGIKSPAGMNGAMLLAALYGEKKETGKSGALVEQILRNILLVENLIQMNALAIELADSHLEAGQPAEALAIYRLVRPRAEVARFQSERVTAARKKLDDTLREIRATPKESDKLLGLLPELRDGITRAEKLRDDAKGLADFTPGLDLRLGRCFSEMGRRWEALVAYGDILERFPDAKEREPALFASVAAYSELNRPESARRLGEQYLEKFPEGTNAVTVGYLLGFTALQADDPETAAGYFGRMLEKEPSGGFAEQMRFLLGNARFSQGKFDEAIKEYERYVSEYPKGIFVEEARYRAAVSLVFAGRYEPAIPAIDKYLQDFPKGAFAPDAYYRRAVCLYAARQYDEVIALCEAWERDNARNPQLGEVLALQGDSLMAKGAADDAIGAYLRSAKLATTDEVLGYSLFEAQKGMQKKGDWEGIAAAMQDFVKDRPDHALVPTAMYWIGRAKVREGKVEEAKAFLVETLAKYLSDPKQAGVEQLLTQLAQLCAKKKPADGSDEDPSAELARLLGGIQADSPAARARRIYAEAELARLRRQPAEETRRLEMLGRDFQAGDLSAFLLAEAADQLLASGDIAKAGQFYHALMETYPHSEVVDHAYAGLGEIAFLKQDWQGALALFDEAIDKGLAAQKLKDVTVGRAKALLALGRLDEARKGFEQVASVREWRGDSTAHAVYALGEIEFKRGQWAEANAFFQRVFVAYQKFLPWVAKSYLGSAECFEKLGKAPEAIRTYEEMLRNEKLAGFAETAVARKRLEALRGGRG